MISDASKLFTPMPSAFTALGIGALGVSGALVPALLLEDFLFTNVSPLNSPKNSRIEELVKPALPFVLAFNYFFVTYAMGLVWIHLGSKLRRHIFGGFDAKRIAFVLGQKNASLERLFLDTQTSAKLMDGLGLAFFTFVTFLGLSLTATNHWSIFPAFLMFGVISCYYLWRTANEYWRSFDQIVDNMVGTNL